MGEGLQIGATGWTSLITVFVLGLAWIAGFSSRLFSVIRYESIIHEFDPWFNYRSTAHMVENGFYEFLNWFDERAWYPLGRIVGGTVYPGLMVTSGFIHYVLSLLNIPVHIREVCVFLAPIFSGMTAIATYLLTKELWNGGAGLFAACFIAIVPGYISRSVAGSYDNEGIAIFALMFTYYLWIKAVKTGTIFWAAMAAVSYFYMVGAWGGYVFIINLVPLHVFVLLLMQRYSARIYVAYTTFYILGLLLSMQIPFVGFQPIRTSEHMASAGVFVLLQAYAALRYLQHSLTKSQFRHFFFLSAVAAAGLVFASVVGLTYLGYVAPWSGRFYSLWDTGYAKIHIPIIASVSEHQPTPWVSFFFDLHILVCVYPAGAWFCIRDLTDERVFIVLYAVFASYFAGVMVRLMLTLTPCVCVLAAIAFSRLFDIYLKDEVEPGAAAGAAGDSSSAVGAGSGASGNKRRQQAASASSSAGSASSEPRNLYDKPKIKQRGDSGSSAVSATGQQGDRRDDEVLGLNVKSVVLLVFVIVILLFCMHCTWVTSNAYSSPSIVLASYNQDGSRVILDDFREAYYWLRRNTHDRARVMSWWDYGYQIAGMANRTTLVDNNTWNNSHIALVGKAMASNETEAYKIMRMLDVDYVLIIFGGVIGYSGDDINKFLWMVRIAEGEHPRDIKESDYFTPQGEYKIDGSASQTMLNSLMYKMSYYRFGEMQTDFRTPPGFDRTRNAEIGRKHFTLKHLEEAFTSEHWMVRIYKVKQPPNRNKIEQPKSRVRVFNTRKTLSNKVGTLRQKPSVVRGKRPARNR
ncbi:hypothetical protein BOX15_Mlig021416g1 [Macrostomum lignano]|uniref:dolichyl-diphosphooligosaccharide--protein glycotransferase n=1 Tax=Macrostomum lignano TaxID=282301 RepID=A0A267EL54_9PLAT|nr:hypothetical protein BOX15_Mlig021416g1 [Macrostomum lignano]